MNIDCTVYRFNRKMAEVEGGQVKFFNKFLRNLMGSPGIPITADLQKFYDNEQYISSENSLFTKAFVEIYYPDYLRRQNCRLEPRDRVNDLAQRNHFMK